MEKGERESCREGMAESCAIAVELFGRCLYSSYCYEGRAAATSDVNGDRARRRWTRRQQEREHVPTRLSAKLARLDDLFRLARMSGHSQPLR